MNNQEAIKILKQRQCCRECVADCKCEDCDKAFEMGREALENQKTGHWIKEWHINHYEYVCSECDCGEDSQPHYCPSCGAKMEGE